jgi:hypothetical protein
MNRDVILITQQGADGPIHICRATQRTTRNTLAKLQTGNPQPLLPVAIIVAGEARHDALIAAMKPQRIRGDWYRLPVPPDDPNYMRDELLERQLRAAVNVQTLNDLAFR